MARKAGSVRPRTLRPHATRVDEDLQYAAAALGLVYASGKRPLASWAIPPASSPRANRMSSQLLLAVQAAYGDQTLQTRNAYSNAYHKVIPELRRTLARMVAETVNRQIQDLNALEQRLAAQGIAGALTVLATGVQRRVGAGFTRTGADMDAATAAHGEPPVAGMGHDPVYWRIVDDNLKQRVQRAIAEELSNLDAVPTELWGEVRFLAKVLSCHPQLVDIMKWYWNGAREGDRLLRGLVREAQAATAEFGARLVADPDHVFRYPPLVVDGVRALGLDDIYGFTEYAVDIGQVIGSDWRDAALFGAALGLSILAVVIPPLAAGGYALTAAITGAAVALTDFGLAGTGAALAYLRDREQDIAAVGAGFRPDKPAARSDYRSTKLAGAFAFLSGLALVNAVGGVVRQLRVRQPTTPPTEPPIAARKRERPDPSALRYRDRDAGSSAPQRSRSVARPLASDRGAFRGPTRTERGLPDEPVRAAVGAEGSAEVAAEPMRSTPFEPRVSDDARAVASGKPGGSGGTGKSGGPARIGSLTGPGRVSAGGGSRSTDPGPGRKRRRPAGEPPPPRFLSQAEADRLQAKYAGRAGTWYPAEEWSYIEKLEERYPQLAGARLRPFRRKAVGAEFQNEERMRTNQGRYTLAAYNDRGEQIIELDGISPNGFVQEVKIQQTNPAKVVESIRQKAAFADGFGLNGVEYDIQPSSIATQVEFLLADSVTRRVYRVGGP
jgi:hypothetical protein